MVALCGEHHKKADAGAFRTDQLRELKRPSPAAVSGRFNWMRNRLLAVVGGNFYYENPIAVAFRDEPQVWFNRDDSGSLLLNLRMVTGSGLPRLRLENNDWLVRGEPVDFESPPSGRRIYARYENEDELRVEFFELPAPEVAHDRYPFSRREDWTNGVIEFPITAVEIRQRVGGTPYEFGPTDSKLPGIRMTGGFLIRNQVGLRWG